MDCMVIDNIIYGMVWFRQHTNYGWYRLYLMAIPLCICGILGTVDKTPAKQASGDEPTCTSGDERKSY